MAVLQIDRRIDARAMRCPGPLMALIGAISEAEIGGSVEVWSTDPASSTDIPAWVAKANHELEDMAKLDGYSRFVVRKAR